DLDEKTLGWPIEKVNYCEWDEDMEEESIIITKWVDWSQESDEEISNSGHSSWKYNKELASKFLKNEDQQEALIQQLARELWAENNLDWMKGHSAEFEDDEDYEMIEQLPCIYLEYPPSEWDFHEVTTSGESNTSEEELPAFNKYIHWDYCNSL
ncbi:7374_t:CDS:2, partial [Gigaspora margarita]